MCDIFLILFLDENLLVPYESQTNMNSNVWIYYRVRIYEQKYMNVPNEVAKKIIFLSICLFIIVLLCRHLIGTEIIKMISITFYTKNVLK